VEAAREVGLLAIQYTDEVEVRAEIERITERVEAIEKSA